MPTTIVKTIGPSGADYTTIQAWDDAAPANLVTSDQVWEGQCKNNAFTGSGTLATISGSTTDATRFKRLKCESGASFRDDGSRQTTALAWNNTTGASISAGDNYGAGIQWNENFGEIDGLMIKGNGSNHPALELVSQNNKVRNCIIEGPNTISSTNDGFLMEQCLIIKTTSGGAGAVMQANFSLYGCTIAKPSDIGAVPSGIAASYLNGACTIKNCALFGFTADLTITSAGGNTVTCTTCATDDATPTTGFTTLTYNTSLFVNITNATKNYRIPTGSGLIGIGTNDATHSATDILNVARPQGTILDIGAHEFNLTSNLPGRLVGGMPLKQLVSGALAA